MNSKKTANIFLTIITFLVLIEVAKSNIAGTGAYPIVSRMMAFIKNSGDGYINSEYKNLTWGQESNGVRVALMPGNPLSNSLFEKKEYVGIVLTNTTNNKLSLVVPEFAYQFDLIVYDENGSLVSRTKNGHDIGKIIPKFESPYAVDNSGHQYDKTSAFELLSAGEFELFSSVNLLDYFRIEKPGKYRVEYEQRLQVATIQSNQVVWVGFACPKAMVSIDVH
jgi:hypothetical protein